MKPQKRRVYFGMWGNQDEMLRDFDQPPGVLFGREVLVAKLDGDQNLKMGHVIYEDRQGRLFRVVDTTTKGGHDIRLHWNPRETSPEELQYTWDIWDAEPERAPDFANDTEFMEALRDVIDARK